MEEPVSIPLTAEMADLVRQRMETGRYESPQEVVCAALWLLSARDHLVSLRKQALMEKVSKAREAATGDLAGAVARFTQAEVEEAPL